MPMKIDPAAAAYGLFQVVFADVINHLAVALFRLRNRKEPNLAFKDVFKLEFKKMMRQFRKELKQFENVPLVSADLGAIRKACAEMNSLGQWRNERIHAHVRQVDGGYVLYDWRTGKPLPITEQDCESNIGRAIKVIVDFEAYMPALVGHFKMEDFSDAFRSMMKEEG